jgi:hypothetical protein
MGHKDEKIKSLNEFILSDMSIKELETRIQLEELNTRGEMWTGCSCADECNYYCPWKDVDCPDDVYSNPPPGEGPCSWVWSAP